MPILDHEHQIIPTEDRLLFPAEIIDKGLDPSKSYYINGRCILPGCSFFTYAEIPRLRIRSPRIRIAKKR